MAATMRVAVAVVVMVVVVVVATGGRMRRLAVNAWTVSEGRRVNGGCQTGPGVCLVLIRRELSETRGSRVGVMKNNEGGWGRFQKDGREGSSVSRGAVVSAGQQVSLVAGTTPAAVVVLALMRLGRVEQWPRRAAPGRAHYWQAVTWEWSTSLLGAQSAVDGETDAPAIEGARVAGACGAGGQQSSLPAARQTTSEGDAVVKRQETTAGALIKCDRRERARAVAASPSQQQRQQQQERPRRRNWAGTPACSSSSARQEVVERTCAHACCTAKVAESFPLHWTGALELAAKNRPLVDRTSATSDFASVSARRRQLPTFSRASESRQDLICTALDQQHRHAHTPHALATRQHAHEQYTSPNAARLRRSRPTQRPLPASSNKQSPSFAETAAVMIAARSCHVHTFINTSACTSVFHSNKALGEQHACSNSSTGKVSVLDLLPGC